MTTSTSLAFCASLILSLSSVSARAVEPDQNWVTALGGRGSFALDGSLDSLREAFGLDLSFSDSDTYRIGDEWGKLPVDPTSLDRASAAFRRAALATARTGGATGFFLGEFDGRLIMATNHHVFSAAFNCLGQTIRFPLLGVTGKCSEFLGTWSEIDLTLFVLDEVSPAGRQALLEVGRNFDFSTQLRQGQELLTVGFGIANNPRRVLMANQDSDCRVFSGTGEYRKMGDPDALNPGTYDAWSFANGCDVSHGDSGSAMVDRSTGAVLGIIWTGKIPKSPQAQVSANLQDWLSRGSGEIWTELSYGVPAPKMGEVLRSVVAQPGKDPRWVSTMKAVLGL